MRKIELLILLFSSIIFAYPAIFLDSISVIKIGRNIQVDGLLVEWSSKSINRSTEISSDYILTPDGLAGYIRYSTADTTNLKKITILNSSNAPIFNIDNHNYEAENYAVTLSNMGDENIYTVVVEWLVPTNQLQLFNNKYNIKIKISDSKNSTNGEIIASGKIVTKNSSDNAIITLLFKILIIVVLLFVFFKLRKSKKLRK